MGEARKRMEMGLPPRNLKPESPITMNIDISKTTPVRCKCGGEYFTPVVRLFTLSALLSPTGQELMGQRPALICVECKTALEDKNTTPGIPEEKKPEERKEDAPSNNQ